MKNSILFAIVTYKEKYFECLSFTSLVRSFRVFNEDKLNVFIFDNTDLEDWKVEVNEIEDLNINYFHQKDNRGISFAYNWINDFAIKNKFEWIVFLDQDTSLPIETYKVYLEKASNISNNPIAVPKVYSNKKIISPSKFIFYRSILFNKIDQNFYKFKNISCINSGLIIKTKLFESLGGYNEKLKLDFCDHDFIEKVKKKICFLEILNIDFIQDFSNDNNNKNQSINRYKIFVADIKQFSKTRNKLIVFLVVDMPHLFKLIYKHKTPFFLKIRFLNKSK
jgi:GT2 family glycosyltransferase